MENLDSTIQNKKSANDEISLKDIIREIRSWKDLFVQNFKTIMFFGLIGGLIGFSYAYFSKPKYTAKLTFVMRADANSAALSGLAGLSSLLGSGTTAASASPLDRIVELVGSDRIVGEALLTSAVIDSKEDLLINHVIKIKQFGEDWQEDTLLSKASFKAGAKFDQLNPAQRKAIKAVTEFIAGKKGILSKSFEKKSGIISMEVSDDNEELAINLTKQIYNKLVKFYTNESIASISSKVDILRNKVDSIQAALGYTQRASATSADQGLGLLLQRDRVEQKRLGLKENVLTIMYGETLKNLEQLDFILATTSPNFSVIDEPFSPIEPDQKSILIFIIVGMFFFVMFYFTFLLTKRWFSSFI